MAAGGLEGESPAWPRVSMTPEGQGDCPLFPLLPRVGLEAFII